MPQHAHHCPDNIIDNLNIGVSTKVACILSYYDNYTHTWSFKSEVDAVVTLPLFLKSAFKPGRKNLFYEYIYTVITLSWKCVSTNLYKKSKNEEDNTLNKHIDESETNSWLVNFKWIIYKVDCCTTAAEPVFV